MSKLKTARERIPITAGGKIEVNVDMFGVLDRKNNKLLSANAPTITVDKGTSSEITLANKQTNSSSVEIDSSPGPRLAAAREVVQFTFAAASSLTDAIYRVKIVATDSDSFTMPAVWVLFYVETGETT